MLTLAASSPEQRLEPPADITVDRVFIAAGLHRAEFDSHGMGVALVLPSVERPGTAQRLILAAGDAQRMIDGLRLFADQLQAELAKRPQAGPLVQ